MYQINMAGNSILKSYLLSVKRLLEIEKEELNLELLKGGITISLY